MVRCRLALLPAIWASSSFVQGMGGGGRRILRRLLPKRPWCSKARPANANPLSPVFPSPRPVPLLATRHPNPREPSCHHHLYLRRLRTLLWMSPSARAGRHRPQASLECMPDQGRLAAIGRRRTLAPKTGLNYSWLRRPKKKNFFFCPTPRVRKPRNCGFLASLTQGRGLDLASWRAVEKTGRDCRRQSAARSERFGWRPFIWVNWAAIRGSALRLTAKAQRCRKLNTGGSWFPRLSGHVAREVR